MTRTMLLEARDGDFDSVVSGADMHGFTVAPGGIAPDDLLNMLRQLARDVGTQFTPSAWWIIDDGEVVGLCSLKQPPDDAGYVEIGFGIAPSRQGRGAARRAVAQLRSWADAASVHLTAETHVDNVRSQRVLEANGFVRVGHREDEDDGRMICWRAVSSPVTQKAGSD